MHWTGRAITIILSIIGIAISWHLFEIHLAVKYGEYVPGGVCDISEAVRCDVAAASDWSSFLDIPIAAWGFGLYFFLMLGFALQKCLPKRTQKALSTLIVLLVSGSVGYSIMLFYVSKFILGALCPFCVALYAVNILTFLALPVALEYKGYLDMLKSAATGLLSGIFSLASVGFAIITVYCLFAFQDYTDQWIRDFQGERYDLKVDLAAEKGHEDAAVPALVELFIFSDFQCPFCWNAHRSMERLLEEFGDKLHVHFVHFPLDSDCNPLIKGRDNLHPGACYASKVALAAKLQGKQEDIVNALFETLDRPKPERTPKLYERIAAQVELDMDTFYADMKNGRAEALLKADIQRGIDFEVRRTPTLFVNGRKIVGFPGETALRRIIKNEIHVKEAEKVPESFGPSCPLSPTPEFSPECWGEPIGQEELYTQPPAKS